MSWISNKIKQNLNVEYRGARIEDFLTKVGKAIGGDTGEELGKKLDEYTKNVTIKIEEKN